MTETRLDVRIGQSIAVSPEYGRHGNPDDPFGGVVVGVGVQPNDDGEPVMVYRTVDWRQPWLRNRRTDRIPAPAVDVVEDSPESRLVMVIRHLCDWVAHKDRYKPRTSKTMDSQEAIYLYWAWQLLRVIQPEPF